MAQLIAEGVHEIDTLLGGWERVTSGYLVDGDEPVLVETGSQSSVPALLAALDALGIAPDALAHVVVTHIHLDHAGGVGDVAQAFPKATIHVHEKGARHLIDPRRLVDSAAMVYGDLLDSLYGRLTPTDAGPGPCPGGRRGAAGRPDPCADDHRLTGSCQAPSRPARLGERPALRR